MILYMISRRSLLWLAGAATSLGAALGVRSAAQARYYDGPISDHWNGETFFNPGKPRHQRFIDLLRWQFGGGRATWPNAAPGGRDHPPRRVDGARLRITMIGHASLLVQTRGLNLLLDPVWSERASPLSFAGPKRVNDPGIAFDELPPIDAVLVSHNHYDHLDVATLAQLSQRDRPRIITPLGNEAIIRNAVPDAIVESFDWREATPLSHDVALHLKEMHHWSARGLFDRNKALWAAFVIDTPDGAIYHVGDSGYGAGDYFRLAAERFPRIRLAMLPIGAYEPRWFMTYSHMNPDEAVRAFRDCQAAHAIGHHWGTFQLTDEAIDAPPMALAAALAAEDIPAERFRLLPPGSAYEVPELPSA